MRNQVSDKRHFSYRAPPRQTTGYTEEPPGVAAVSASAFRIAQAPLEPRVS